FGLVAFGSSLDQIGPLTRSVEDATMLLQVIAGGDVHDATCHQSPAPNLVSDVRSKPESLRIGVPRQYVNEHNDSQINSAVQRAIDALRSTGATIVDIDLPLTDYGIATYYIIATAEASSNLARFDGVRYGRRAAMTASDDLWSLYARSRTEG